VDISKFRFWSGALTKARITRFGWEGFWVVFGQAVAVVGAVVGVRVLTKLLPPEVYGELALAMTGATLLNQVVFGPISNGASRFYAVAQEAADIPAYLLAVKRLALVATGWVMAGATSVAAFLLLTGYVRWLGLLLAALGFALLSGYNGILDAVQNAARQRLVVAWHQGLAAWGRFLVAAGVIVLLGASSTVAMVGFAMALLLVLSSQGWFLTRSTREVRCHIGSWQSTIPQWQTQIVSYSWSFVTMGLFNWAYYASQSWAIKFFGTAAEVGLFQALMQVASTPVTMAGQVFLSFVTPIVFARVGNSIDQGRLKRTERLVLCFALLAIGCAFVLAVMSHFVHQWVFRFLVAPEYWNASGYMPYVVLAAGILQASQIMGLLLLVWRLPHRLLGLSIWGQLYVAIQNFLLQMVFGMTGLVISILVGAVVHLLWMSAIVWRNRRTALLV